MIICITPVICYQEALWQLCQKSLWPQRIKDMKSLGFHLSNRYVPWSNIWLSSAVFSLPPTCQDTMISKSRLQSQVNDVRFNYSHGNNSSCSVACTLCDLWSDLCCVIMSAWSRSLKNVLVKNIQISCGNAFGHCGVNTKTSLWHYT